MHTFMLHEEYQPLNGKLGQKLDILYNGKYSFCTYFQNIGKELRELRCFFAVRVV